MTALLAPLLMNQPMTTALQESTAAVAELASVDSVMSTLTTGAPITQPPE